ncbi:MAG: LysR family transcriptional regulator [Rhizobiaceae bacterium]
MHKRPFDLGWMRVLVESVRRGSLSAAASVLSLTQPAVSYQIRRAEEEAGFAILRRGHKGVELTGKGRKLFEIVERTVDEVDRLMREQRQAGERPAVRLRTDYAFSQFWLIPRMHSFRLRHPQTDIQIVATQRFEPGAMEEGDIAVVFGADGEFGANARLLLPESVVPIATQAYLDRHPGNLSTARLIHLDAEYPAPWFDWPRYFSRFGMVRDTAASQGDISLNTFALVNQAVLEHQGVALGWRGLIDGFLRSGILVEAGEWLAAHRTGYWLVAAPSPGLHTDELASWLTEEVA